MATSVAPRGPEGGVGGHLREVGIGPPSAAVARGVSDLDDAPLSCIFDCDTEASALRASRDLYAAIDESVPCTVLSAALYSRFTSRHEENFAWKVAQAMRRKFGGH